MFRRMAVGCLVLAVTLGCLAVVHADDGKGGAANGQVAAVDAAGHTITLLGSTKDGRKGPDLIYTVNADAKVIVDGQPASLKNVRTGTPVQLKIGPDGKVLALIQQEGKEKVAKPEAKPDGVKKEPPKDGDKKPEGFKKEPPKDGDKKPEGKPDGVKKEAPKDGEKKPEGKPDGVKKEAPKDGDKKPESVKKEPPKDGEKKPEAFKKEPPKDGEKKTDGVKKESPKDGDKKPDGVKKERGDKKPNADEQPEPKKKQPPKDGAAS